MLIEMLKSKIHCARVTATHLDYAGSITVDATLIAEAGLVRHEKVLIANLTNGARFTTYVIEGAAGTGCIEINGAAARLCDVDDKIIVMSFAQLSQEEAATFQPRIVIVDDQNRPSEYSF